MAKSRVSDESTELLLESIVGESVEPAKSPMRAKTADFHSKTADVSLLTNADFVHCT